jgi:hypothetical protein
MSGGSRTTIWRRAGAGYPNVPSLGNGGGRLGLTGVAQRGASALVGGVQGAAHNNGSLGP